MALLSDSVLILVVRHHLWVYMCTFYYCIMSSKRSYSWVMHSLLNQTPHSSQHIFPPQLSRFFVSNMYIRYLRHPGANVRWCYSHCKYIFSSSFACKGVHTLSIKDTCLFIFVSWLFTSHRQIYAITAYLPAWGPKGTHSLYCRSRHIPLFYKGGQKWGIGHQDRLCTSWIYHCGEFRADRVRFK